MVVPSHAIGNYYAQSDVFDVPFLVLPPYLPSTLAAAGALAASSSHRLQQQQYALAQQQEQHRQHQHHQRAGAWYGVDAAQQAWALQQSANARFVVPLSQPQSQPTLAQPQHVAAQAAAMGQQPPGWAVAAHTEFWRQVELQRQQQPQPQPQQPPQLQQQPQPQQQAFVQQCTLQYSPIPVPQSKPEVQADQPSMRSVSPSTGLHRSVSRGNKERGAAADNTLRQLQLQMPASLQKNHQPQTDQDHSCSDNPLLSLPLHSKDVDVANVEVEHLQAPSTAATSETPQMSPHETPQMSPQSPRSPSSSSAVSTAQAEISVGASGTTEPPSSDKAGWHPYLWSSVASAGEQTEPVQHEEALEHVGKANTDSEVEVAVADIPEWADGPDELQAAPEESRESQVAASSPGFNAMSDIDWSAVSSLDPSSCMHWDSGDEQEHVCQTRNVVAEKPATSSISPVKVTAAHRPTHSSSPSLAAILGSWKDQNGSVYEVFPDDADYDDAYGAAEGGGKSSACTSATVRTTRNSGESRETKGLIRLHASKRGEVVIRWAGNYVLDSSPASSSTSTKSKQVWQPKTGGEEWSTSVVDMNVDGIEWVHSHRGKRFWWSRVSYESRQDGEHGSRGKRWPRRWADDEAFADNKPDAGGRRVWRAVVAAESAPLVAANRRDRKHQPTRKDHLASVGTWRKVQK